MTLSNQTTQMLTIVASAMAAGAAVAVAVGAVNSKLPRTNPRSRRVLQGMKYMVEAKTPTGWKEVYSAPSKAKAAKDAAKWRKDTGQETRIVKGPDHPDHAFRQGGVRR